MKISSFESAIPGGSAAATARTLFIEGVGACLLFCGKPYKQNDAKSAHFTSLESHLINFTSSWESRSHYDTNIGI